MNHHFAFSDWITLPRPTDDHYVAIADVHGQADLLAPVLDIETWMVSRDQRNSMRWIRSGWVGYDKPLPENLFVIYGHTIHAPRPLVARCQAGIDLGAYRSGILCAAEVIGDRMRFIFVGKNLFCPTLRKPCRTSAE